MVIKADKRMSAHAVASISQPTSFIAIFQGKSNVFALMLNSVIGNYHPATSEFFVSHTTTVIFNYYRLTAFARD